MSLKVGPRHSYPDLRSYHQCTLSIYCGEDKIMPLDSNPTLTIMTPTWNRRHLLPRLYESLLVQQTPKGTFVWLVIDDGSTDGTADWLGDVAPDAPFQIQVITQENGGKHRALNRGAAHVRSPWLLIVDSDDWLLPEGIALALREVEDASSETLAIIAPLDLMGQELCQFEIKKGLVNYNEWAGQSRVHGVRDTSGIMRREVLRDFPFPSIEEEKYLAESVVWSQAFRHGGIKLSNNRVVAAEYQPDGLSAGGRRLETQNPVGAMMACKGRLDLNFGIAHHVRNSVNYSRYYWHALSLGRSVAADDHPMNFFFRWAGYVRFLHDRVILSRDAR